MLLRALISIPDVGQIDAFVEPWRRLYAQSPLLSTVVLFGHLGGLLAAGGLAVAAERATLRLDPGDESERRRHLADLGRIVEGRSDGTEVRREVGDRRYGLIVIDGDHSEEIALHDLVWAESLVEPGALVILDKFEDPGWPGVALALEGYLKRPAATLQLIGTAGTTAFLRATAAAKPA